MTEKDITTAIISNIINDSYDESVPMELRDNILMAIKYDSQIFNKFIVHVPVIFLKNELESKKFDDNSNDIIAQKQFHITDLTVTVTSLKDLKSINYSELMRHNQYMYSESMEEIKKTFQNSYELIFPDTSYMYARRLMWNHKWNPNEEMHDYMIRFNIRETILDELNNSIISFDFRICNVCIKDWVDFFNVLYRLRKENDVCRNFINSFPEEFIGNYIADHLDSIFTMLSLDHNSYSHANEWAHSYINMMKELIHKKHILEKIKFDVLTSFEKYTNNDDNDKFEVKIQPEKIPVALRILYDAGFKEEEDIFL